MPAASARCRGLWTMAGSRPPPGFRALPAVAPGARGHRMLKRSGSPKCPAAAGYPLRPHAEIIGAVVRSIVPVSTLARCRSISASVASPAATSR